MISYFELYDSQEKEIARLKEQLNECIKILAQHNLIQKNCNENCKYNCKKT